LTDNINIENIFNHWLKSSQKDFETMIHLYDSGDYHWSLFIGHIVIEKLLKASVVRYSQIHAPFTHDLSKLAKGSGISFSEEHYDWMDTITTFNLNARYDSYKEEFYKKCTPEFTLEWIENIKTLNSWISQTLLK